MAVRKRDDEEYWKWIPSLMLTNTPIIAHVATDSIGTRLVGLRGTRGILVVTSPISHFYSRKYMDYIENTDDPERFRYSAEYSLVMHEKAFLLQSAVRLNPFHSEYFFWLDIGIDRSGFMSGINWGGSLPACVIAGRVVVNDVVGTLGVICREAPLAPNDVVSRFAFPNTGVGGGVFGGNAAAVQAFSVDYYAEMDKFVKAKARLTSDQIILSSLACSSKVAVVVPDDTVGDRWFYLLHKMGTPGAQIEC